MNRRCLAAAVATAALFVPAPVRSAPELTAERFPVIAAPVAQMRDALIAGAVENGVKVRISTSTLRYPVHRSGLLAGQDVNSANVALTSVIDKQTGTTHITVTIVDRLRRKQVTMSEAFFYLGDREQTAPLRKVDETSVTEPQRWTRSCNRFTGCQPILMGGGTMWTTVYEADVPAALLQQMLAGSTASDSHLTFWVDDKANKAAKHARDTDDPQLLLFRNEAQALAEAVRAKGGRI